MITSSSNSKIKHVCQLVTKAKARRTEQLFVVEGIRMAKEAPKELLKEVYVSTSFCKKKNKVSCWKLFPYLMRKSAMTYLQK